MVTPGKMVNFVGELCALSTEKILNGTGKITLKISKKIQNDELKRIGSQGIIASRIISNDICKITKKCGDGLDKTIDISINKLKGLKDDAFKHEIRIYGEAKTIYEEDKIIEVTYDEET